MGPSQHDEIAENVPRLRQIEHLALASGNEGLAREAREVATRVEEGRFYVACVGQFKRGKSTLLNALIGVAILPMGVVPVTSAITILRHGAKVTARVLFQDGRSEEVPASTLGAYVSEEENHENRKGVRAVEVFVPSKLLAHGLCLVDTPGLGSPFGGNAAVTREFVPQLDAALLVVGADPPISGEELDLAQDVASNIRHLLFIMNKADRLTDDERSQGARFAAETLSARLRRPVGRLLEVSATERLAGGVATRDWPELENRLLSLARDSGADLLRTAESRAAERLARALLRDLEERRDALVRPLSESEARLEALRASVEGAERALQDLGVLLGAESSNLARSFRERQEAFLPGARDEARKELADGAKTLTCPRTHLRAEAYRLAQGAMRRLVERFRAELEPAADAEYRRAMQRFVALANDFLARLAASGEPGLESLPQAVGPESGLRVASHVYYTDMLDRTLSLTSWFADAICPRALVLSSALRVASRYLDDLIEANSSRVANDLSERVAQSRARLESELRENLHRVTATAARALSRAQARRAEGEAAVMEELKSIASLRPSVEALLHPPQGDSA